MDATGLLCGTCAATVAKLSDRRPKGELTPILGTNAQCAVCRCRLTEGAAIAMTLADTVGAFTNALELMGVHIRPIPVSERMPEQDAWCLFFQEGEWSLGLHDGVAWYLAADGRYKTALMGEPPTHWLPLPPKPEQQNETR